MSLVISFARPFPRRSLYLLLHIIYYNHRADCWPKKKGNTGLPQLVTFMAVFSVFFSDDHHFSSRGSNCFDREEDSVTGLEPRLEPFSCHGLDAIAIDP